MPIVHRSEEDETILADQIEVADSLPSKMWGLRFRRSIPEDYALVFPFESAGRRDVDMLFVPFPIDVLWLVDGRVERASTLRSWLGFGVERADTLVELPAGTAASVCEGDRVRIENGENSGA